MYVCMYVYKHSVDIVYLLCMIKFRVRLCTCRMLLPCGKLITRKMIPITGRASS